MSAIIRTVPQKGRPGWARWAGVVAIVFGVATLASGGLALFGGQGPRDALGAIVPFVLWFNFLSGPVYVAAGAGLLLWRTWAVKLAGLLAFGLLIVAGMFCLHVWGGGAYEIRTVGALILRFGFWAALAIAARNAMAR